MFRRQLRQQTKLGSKQLEDCKDQALQPRPSHPSNTPSQDEDSGHMDFSAPRKSRLSAPQFQAQLSRLTDRTRLRAHSSPKVLGSR